MLAPVAQPAPDPVPAKSTFWNELSVLAPLLAFYTLLYMGLMAVDFALKARFDIANGMQPVYIALVAAYAADKEIRRWVGKPEPSRKGTVFVYLWMIFFAVAWVIRSFRPEYVFPLELQSVTMQVLGLFFGSKASKYIHGRLGPSETDLSREEMILQLLDKHGDITRKMVSYELKMSGRSASRLLEGLEKRGLILRQGIGKGIHYIKPPEAPTQ